MWGETWSGCIKGGKGWVVPKGKAAAVGTEPFGSAQAEWAMSPGTGNASRVLWVQGRNRGGRSQLRERVEQGSSRLLLQ